MKRDVRATWPLRWHSLISNSIRPIPHGIADFLVLTLIMIRRRAVQPHEAKPEISQPDEQVEDGWRLTLPTMQETKRQDWEWALRKWILSTCSGIRLSPVRNPSWSSSGDYHGLILFHKEILFPMDMQTTREYYYNVQTNPGIIHSNVWTYC